VATSGGLRCWGAGFYGQLGYGNTDSIGLVDLPSDFGEVSLGGKVDVVAAGFQHTCALLENGDVYCWGSGVDGRLGYSSTSGVGDDEAPASVGPVSLGGSATQVGVGAQHSCALIGGSVRCWGAGSDGMLGNLSSAAIGDNEEPSSQAPVELGGTVEQLAVGGLHTCAVIDGSKIRCWGLGLVGRLGYGNTDTVGDDEAPSSVPAIDMGRAVKEISAGSLHTCALVEGGDVYCWGENRYGQLGLGHTNNIGDDEPIDLANPIDLGGAARAISAGGGHTCAIMEDGKVICWGHNHRGQLGYGHTNDIGDDEGAASGGFVQIQ
jgi:alpha-tubulin suppressor-like RCC1 family protein